MTDRNRQQHYKRILTDFTIQSANIKGFRFE